MIGAMIFGLFVLACFIAAAVILAAQERDL
jgi:hypothetical protein